MTGGEVDLRPLGSSDDLRIFSLTRDIRVGLVVPPLHDFDFAPISTCFFEEPYVLKLLDLLTLYLSTSVVEFERRTLALDPFNTAPNLAKALFFGRGNLTGFAGLCIMEGGGLEALFCILTLCEVFAA